MTASTTTGVTRVELRRDAGRIGPQLGPWIRRRQIARFLGAPDPHLLAQVVDHRGEALGWGLVSAVSNITVRMLSFGEARPAEDWLGQRLSAAFAARDSFGFAAADTTGYRLVNSEGDGIPGLVIDRYGAALVVQLGSAPIAAREAEIAAWLATQWSGPLHFVVPEAAARYEGIEATLRDGSGGTLTFTEDGLRFEVPAPPAQKTGAYFDQRDNRRRVAALASAHGGAMLDLGCHVGGFALHAARLGLDVVALDRSKTALEHGRRNAAANGLDQITWVEADMFTPLRDPALVGPFGTIVFDPPKLTSRRDDLEQAVDTTARVVRELARRLAPRGHLVLCSCSHHLGREHLDQALTRTGLAFTRTLALGAGPDHPVALGHREGEYLRVNVYQPR